MTYPGTGLALAWHELCMWHDTTASAGSIEGGEWVEPGEPGEGPTARRRLKGLLDASGVTRQLLEIGGAPLPEEALTAVHAPAYVRRVARIAASGGGSVGPNVPLGRRGLEIAALAAGLVCATVDAVCEGRVRRGFALVRPAGHHAHRDGGMGNCIFNNLALGVEHARSRHGLVRLAVVDWDVHHGNGTEAIFFEDDDVLTISLHQEDWYPRGSGAAGSSGAAANVNVPLPAGSGNGAYLAAMERVVAPALREHRPEAVLVACGLDANAMDPFGRMLVTASGFRALTDALVAVAEDVCGGRVVAALEGGYSPLYVPFCGLAVVEALAGLAGGLDDPYADRYGGGWHALSPAQEEAVATAIPTDMLSRYDGNRLT